MATQGIVNPATFAGSVEIPIFDVALDWFAPRNSFFKWVPKTQFGADIFKLTNTAFRPSGTTLAAAITSTSATTITLTDATALRNGDVIMVGSEYMQVSSVNTSTNVATVIRGVSGTTAATASNGATVTFYGVSSPGNEDNPTAITMTDTVVTSYTQRFLHPYSVGDGLIENTQFMGLAGQNAPLDRFRMQAMAFVMDDVERTLYFGKKEQATTTLFNKTDGLKSIITTNKVTSPTNASAYKAVDFQRDFFTAPRITGGAPNTIFLASNWMTAFTTWGVSLQLIEEGDSVFGRNIRTWRCAFLGDSQIVECNLLPSFSGFSLTSEEVELLVKKPVTDVTYGKSGDNTKGHIVCEVGLRLDNESHHAWVEGVTAFAA